MRASRHHSGATGPPDDDRPRRTRFELPVDRSIERAVVAIAELASTTFGSGPLPSAWPAVLLLLTSVASSTNGASPPPGNITSTIDWRCLQSPLDRHRATAMAAFATKSVPALTKSMYTVLSQYFGEHLLSVLNNPAFGGEGTKGNLDNLTQFVRRLAELPASSTVWFGDAVHGFVQLTFAARPGLGADIAKALVSRLLPAHTTTEVNDDYAKLWDLADGLACLAKVAYPCARENELARKLNQGNAASRAMHANQHSRRRASPTEAEWTWLLADALLDERAHRASDKATRALLVLACTLKFSFHLGDNEHRFGPRDARLSLLARLVRFCQCRVAETGARPRYLLALIAVASLPLKDEKCGRLVVDAGFVGHSAKEVIYGQLYRGPAQDLILAALEIFSGAIEAINQTTGDAFAARYPAVVRTLPRMTAFGPVAIRAPATAAMTALLSLGPRTVRGFVQAGGLCRYMAHACVGLQQSGMFPLDSRTATPLAGVLTAAIVFGSADDVHAIITSTAFTSVLRLALAKATGLPTTAPRVPNMSAPILGFDYRVAVWRHQIRNLIETALRKSPLSHRLCLTHDDLYSLLDAFAFNRNLDCDIGGHATDFATCAAHRAWRQRVRDLASSTGLLWGCSAEGED